MSARKSPSDAAPWRSGLIFCKPASKAHSRPNLTQAKLFTCDGWRKANRRGCLDFLMLSATLLCLVVGMSDCYNQQ